MSENMPELLSEQSYKLFLTFKSDEKFVTSLSYPAFFSWKFIHFKRISSGAKHEISSRYCKYDGSLILRHKMLIQYSNKYVSKIISST